MQVRAINIFSIVNEVLILNFLLEYQLIVLKTSLNVLKVLIYLNITIMKKYGIYWDKNQLMWRDALF